MINYESILQGSPNGVLATRCQSGVRTRVFQYLFTEGKRVYFCTSSEKPVYVQTCLEPHVSFCTWGKDFDPVLSLNGRAVYDDDPRLKARALAENPPIRAVFGSPDNPVFKLFYIDLESIDAYSAAKGPRHYVL
jgi:uncharacterized pyridoxamine 5'-phosphate oxidase family protein